MTRRKVIVRAAKETRKHLSNLTVKHLKQIACILGLRQGRRVKGGKFKVFRKQELVDEIKKISFEHSFTDGLLRYLEYFDNQCKVDFLSSETQEMLIKNGIIF